VWLRTALAIIERMTAFPHPDWAARPGAQMVSR
jgi:hypothetical protein